MFMYERKFNVEDQNIFAKLSGDFNSLHLDEIIARRYLFGGPVVHGIHMVLWALDKWIGKLDRAVELVSLKVSFSKPLPVGESVQCRLIHEMEHHVELELFGEEDVYTFISGEWKFSDTQETIPVDQHFPQRKECKVLTADEILNRSGELELSVERATADRLFPNLAKHLSLLQIAQLLAATRLVGMECPGFYSVFLGLDVSFASNDRASSLLRYKVTSFDHRFSLLKMDITGPSMTGLINALLRPPPCRQASFSDLCNRVMPGEFSGQCALIIGGSRGLGEVTSKLLAAGGAQVTMTYFKGEQDAKNIANEIVSKGGKADIMHWNVLDPQETRIQNVAKTSPTHLYYFATPRIAANREEFSEKLFRSFCDYYVSRFSSTLTFFLKHFSTVKKVFYPSSIFIEEQPLPFSEYAAAKSAGEVLCSFFEKYEKNISIYRPRLPKMATDQTVSVIPSDSSDPVPIMLKQLRYFRDYSRSNEVR